MCQKEDFKTPEIFWISDEINLTQLRSEFKRYIVISNMVIDKKIVHYLDWTEIKFEYNVAGDITFVNKDNP